VPAQELHWRLASLKFLAQVLLALREFLFPDANAGVQ
jgi:hypothetical protein